MKKGFLFTVFLSIIFSLIFAVPSLDAKPPEIALKQKKSVVTVSVDNKKGENVYSGSGLVVDQRGVVATSCRAILKWFEAAENTLLVKTEEGAEFPIDHLISNNCNNNIVLILVKGKGLPAAKFAPDYKAKHGERVAVIAGALGAEAALSEGIIKAFNAKDGTFQVGALASSWLDGSAVFNQSGEVIGISTLLPGKKQTVPVVITVKYVLKEFGKYRHLIREPSAPVHSAPPVTLPAHVPMPASPEKSGDSDRPLQEKADQEFLRGCSYDKSNMYKDAVEAYRLAIGIKPDYAEAYVNLGLDYYRLGRYSDAADAYEQAIKIKPDTPSAYSKLGAAFIILGKYSMALDAFRRSLKIDPKNSETHFDLGVASIIAGDKNGAIEEYIILKELDKNRADKLLDLIY